MRIIGSYWFFTGLIGLSNAMCMTNASEITFTVGADGIGPSAPISLSVSSVGTATGIYVPHRLLVSSDFSVTVSSNGVETSVYGVLAVSSSDGVAKIEGVSGDINISSNLTFDAYTVNVDSDFAASGNVNFRYDTTANFNGEFTGGDVSFGDVQYFHVGPVVLNFAKEFSPSGFRSAGSAALDGVKANFNGGLRLSALSRSSFDSLALLNGAYASLNGSVLVFDFSNYAGSGSAGFDFFRNLTSGAIGTIGDVLIVGATSELSASEIAAKIYDGSFSDESVFFDMEFSPSNAPFETSLAARESAALVFAEHLGFLRIRGRPAKGEIFAGVENLDTFGSDGAIWRQSFGADFYAVRGFAEEVTEVFR